MFQLLVLSFGFGYFFGNVANIKIFMAFPLLYIGSLLGVGIPYSALVFLFLFIYIYDLLYKSFVNETHDLIMEAYS